MKINDVTKILGAYDTAPPAGRAVPKTAPVVKKDKVVLSKDAMDFQSVMRALKQTPDIRADKVAEFKAKYEAGEQLADAKDIAEALIKSGAIRRP